MRIRRLLPLLTALSMSVLGVVAAWLVPRTAQTATMAPPTLPQLGQLSWDVRDAATGNPIPCKLTFVAPGGGPGKGPQFTHNDIGREMAGAVAAHDRIMASDGLGAAFVPHGVYDVYVSRGPEWDIAIQRKLAIGPKPAKITARLKHVVDSSGWISADFHVHAHMSTDSHVPMHDRVYEFLSDGVEIITSTDHNVVADYAPVIQELGMGREITSIAGDEMTTGAWGHFGAFPLPQDLERAGHGAVLVHGRTAADFFKDVRVNAPGAIIDVHHPRIDREIGYFNLAGFDARGDKAQKPGFSFDFDALEVLNGYQDPERRSVDRLIDEWFQLLDHGHVVTATGNSDTHHLDHNIGGYPRNYLKVRDDRPSSVRPLEIAQAVKHHHAFFTTAPFVRMHVNGVDVGEVVDARAGKVKVEIEVQAAPWVSVSRVTLWQSGREVKKWPVAKSDAAVRFHETVELPVEAGRDGYVVARVDGDEPLAPIVGDKIHFDVRPLALTNPIFLDRDGNGVFDPPLGPPLRGK